MKISERFKSGQGHQGVQGQTSQVPTDQEVAHALHTQNMPQAAHNAKAISGTQYEYKNKNRDVITPGWDMPWECGKNIIPRKY